MNNIKLLATDLDGTLLDSAMCLTRENREALEQCISRGIEVVIATGRALSAIPEDIRSIDGLKWLICSNGAKIYNNITEEQIFASYLSPEALTSVRPILEDNTIMKEVFVDGKPYVAASVMDDLGWYGIPEYFQDYVRETRDPVPDLPAFIWEHAELIENINFIHKDEEDKIALLYKLTEHAGLYTLTQSLRFNLEIGGIDTDKAFALRYICEMLGIEREETMGIGDNNNDVSMLDFAGIGVAMEDGSQAAKDAADYITTDSDHDGVAFAVEIFIQDNE